MCVKKGTPSPTTSELPPRKEPLLDLLSQVAIKWKLLDFIRGYRTSRLQTRDCLTKPPSEEGGGCEALGGSSSFTQNYLFKRFINETPLRLRLRQIHLSLSERLWFANVRLPKGSPYGIAGAVRLRGIFTSINFSNCAINPNLTATFLRKITIKLVGAHRVRPHFKF